MSDIEAPTALEQTRTTDPAVGLVTTADSGNNTAGQILRAYRQGHDVIVTARGANDPEGIQFARQLGATVLPPAAADGASDARRRLVEAAREEGYPGLLYCESPTAPINFERSMRALDRSEAYAVTAETGQTIETSPEILVAVPAYNEAETISEVVAGAQTHADAVLVVDDGSSDTTPRNAEDAGATVVDHDTNRGYGAALQTAFGEARACGADHLVILDGDGQHDPDDIPKFVDAQQQSAANVVVGCRFGRGTDTDLPLYRRVGIGVANLLTNLSMGMVRSRSRIRDTQCGFRSFDRTAIESLATAPDIDGQMGASTDILHHAQLNNLEIAEVQTTVDYSVEDANNYNPVHHGVMLVMNLVETIERERPITSLGLPGLALTLVGFGFGYWTLQIYVQKQLFPIAHALASSFFTLAGIFMTFTGIILHAIHTHLD